MPTKKHRLLLPSDGIHVVHAWSTGDLGELTQQLTHNDVGKVARMGRPDVPQHYDFFVLTRFEHDEGLQHQVTWEKLSLGSDAWYRWTVGWLGEVQNITPADAGSVARVVNSENPSDVAYYVLSAVGESEGYYPIWVRLDNVEPDLSALAYKLLPVWLEQYNTHFALSHEHAGALIVLDMVSGSAAQYVSIPDDQSIDLPVGYMVTIVRGANNGYLAAFEYPDINLVMNSDRVPACRDVGSAITAVKIAASTWWIYGDMATSWPDAP